MYLCLPSQNLSALQNLKILSIQSNRIPSITNLSSLPHLEELYISHNALTVISGLDSNKSLRVLDVSNNQIKSLTGLEHLSQLEEFWASSNQLSSFDEVEKQLKDKEALETVYLEMNPLQLAQPPLYRNKVRLALPQIKKIDACESSCRSCPDTLLMFRSIRAVLNVINRTIEARSSKLLRGLSGTIRYCRSICSSR